MASLLIWTCVFLAIVALGALWSNLKTYNHKKRQKDHHVTTTPTQFEDLVANYYRAKGYWKVERVGRAGDHGADILCYDKKGLIVIQCKKYRSDAKLGPRLVREVAGAMQYYGAKQGIIFTTATFSHAAKEAAQKMNIKLIGSQTIEELQKYTPRPVVRLPRRK